MGFLGCVAGVLGRSFEQKRVCFLRCHFSSGKYLKTPMVLNRFFFEIHFLRFLVAIGHLPPYRERGPIATESLIYVFSDFEMSLFL